jgi:hypothetical protein
MIWGFAGCSLHPLAPEVSSPMQHHRRTLYQGTTGALGALSLNSSATKQTLCIIHMTDDDPQTYPPTFHLLSMDITKHCMASKTSNTAPYYLLRPTTTAHGWRPALVPVLEAIRVRDSTRHKRVYSHNHSHNHGHKTPRWPPQKHQNPGPTARPLPRGTLLRTRSKGYA